MKMKKITSLLTACAMLCTAATVLPEMPETMSITASAEETAEYTEGTYELLTYRNYGDYIEITGCDTSATEVVIPSEIDGVKVTVIGYQAFFCCTSLTSIIIPDSVTRIEDGSFSWCESLTSITIPDSVTSIGHAAFSKCGSLTSITIPDSVTNIGYDAFSQTPWFEDKQAENPLVIVNNYLIDGTICEGDVVIPDGVTSIGCGAFDNCNSLTSITIPDSVTNIMDYAFRYCGSLTNISIPNNVTSIGNEVFYSCRSLISVTIPNSVTSIGDGAFFECTSLVGVTIPDSVMSIGHTAFYGCTALTSLTIENPNCKIYDAPGTICNGYNGECFFTGTIYGYENSTAQTYAETYGYAFESLGEAPAPEIPLADLNGDATIDATDASALLIAAANAGSGAESGLTAEQEAAADLNGDGAFDASDASLILMYAAYTGSGGTMTIEEFLATM